jgi:hypothetical protein
MTFPEILLTLIWVFIIVLVCIPPRYDPAIRWREKHECEKQDQQTRGRHR